MIQSQLPPSTSTSPLRLRLAAATLRTPTPRLHLPRRSLLLLTTSLSISPTARPSHASPTPLPDTTITDRVYMDFSLCPNYIDRTVSDDIVSLCSESVPIGRLVIGLYGRLVPVTVANFKSMCTASNPNASTYKNTLVHKIFPGQFFLAGRQGRPDKGEVRPPSDLPRNTETVDPRAFSLSHSKGGLLSLCLSENDDDDQIKLDPNYRNVEFLITTGPGPCPQLDTKNIVFGSVLEGFDVVTTIGAIPTYQPGENIRQFNELAEFFGDERAQNARGTWNSPLKTVFISGCGELKNLGFLWFRFGDESSTRIGSKLDKLKSSRISFLTSVNKRTD